MDNEKANKTWLLTVKSVNNKERNLKAVFLAVIKLATNSIKLILFVANSNNNSFKLKMT